MIIVKTVQEAWAEVNKMFPGDYDKDYDSTVRAGYPIYRNSAEYYNYICDLGNRLEINLKEGNRTINIWIQPEPTDPTKEDVEDVASRQFGFEPQPAQIVKLCIAGYDASPKADIKVYAKLKSSEQFEQYRLASDLVSAYCNSRNMEWATIRIISVHNYAKNEQEGHIIVEAIVTMRSR